MFADYEGINKLRWKKSCQEVAQQWWVHTGSTVSSSGSSLQGRHEHIGESPMKEHKDI